MMGFWIASELSGWLSGVLAFWVTGILAYWHFGRPLRSEAGEVESWLTIHPQSVRHLHRRAQSI